MMEVLYDRFWTICRRFLYTTLRDENYHDACIQWTLHEMEESFPYKDYTSEHSCCLYHWNIHISFGISNEEIMYLHYYFEPFKDDDFHYDHKDYEEEHAYVPCYIYQPGKVKPYKIIAEIRNHHSDLVSTVSITTDELPSRLYISRILDPWKQQIDAPLKTYLASYMVLPYHPQNPSEPII